MGSCSGPRKIKPAALIILFPCSKPAMAPHTCRMSFSLRVAFKVLPDDSLLPIRASLLESIRMVAL